MSKVKAIPAGLHTVTAQLTVDGASDAFGYNFEGALQEFVLVDERVIIASDGESMLIPAPEDLSASAIALCEPWACVEDAYVEKQRRHFKKECTMLHRRRQ